MKEEIKKKIEKIAEARYPDPYLSGNPLIYGKRIGFVDGYEHAQKSIEEQPGDDAVSFAEWIQKSGWIKSVTNPGKILWFDGKSEMYDKPYITTYQLYNIYKNRPQ